MLIRPITLGLCTFLITLLLQRWWIPASAPRWCLAILGILVVISSTTWRHPKVLRYFLAIALGSVLAIAMQSLRVPDIDASNILQHAGSTLRIRGWVAEPPERQPTRTRFVVHVAEALGEHDTVLQATGRIRVTDAQSWPRYEMGDAVVVTGKLEQPGVINGFDEATALRLHGITAVMRRAAVSPWNDAPPAPRNIRLSPMAPLARLREWYERQITRVVPEPHASLLAGLLTGSRVGLPQDLTDALRRAGLSHIVAISGYNVTIILSLASGMLFWLPRKRRLLPLIAGTAAFVLFVGAGAPVVRAGLMGMLGLIALEAARPLTPRLLILWTAALMGAWNPLALQNDVSFQLSFLATIGLAEIGPHLVRILRPVPATLAIRESLAATLAAQIATLPLSILVFRQFSLIAPLSNLLVAPLIPLAMLTGAIGTLLGIVALPLGLAVSYGAWAILELILRIATTSAALPLAAVTW